MTDLTIIQFMISGALLLGLISIGFLVVHLRKAIEQLHQGQAQLDINIVDDTTEIRNNKREISFIVKRAMLNHDDFEKSIHDITKRLSAIENKECS